MSKLGSTASRSSNALSEHGPNSPAPQFLITPPSCGMAVNFLNYSLGSCGELHSCYVSFHRAEQISDEQHEQLDRLHYKVENGLLKLVESLRKKRDELLGP